MKSVPLRSKVHNNHIKLRFSTISTFNFGQATGLKYLLYEDAKKKNPFENRVVHTNVVHTNRDPTLSIIYVGDKKIK